MGVAAKARPQSCIVGGACRTAGFLCADRSGHATAARLRRRTPLVSLVEPRDQAVVAPYSSVSNKPGSYARIDNPLGLGNNFLCSTFLEIGRAISQSAGRASRIDRCPPALADRAYLNSISLVVDRYHCCDVASARMRLDRPRVGEWGATQDSRMPAEVKRRKHVIIDPNVCRRRPDNKSKDPS